MAITSYFINKTNIVNNKYKKIMNNILADYRENKIKTETEYLYIANVATKHFIKNLSIPLFKYKEALSLPIAEHFNDMVNNAVDDIDVLLNEAIDVGTNTNSVNNEILAYMQMLDTSSNQLVKTISQLESNINDIRSDKHYIFSDTFDDMNGSLLPISSDTCKIHLESGVLTLNTTIERDYTSTLMVKLLDSSNGFPGNTHEVEVLNGKFQFIGENEPYVNMYNMSDGKSSTWFEYEGYHISDEEYLKCNGFGFDYKEGLSWVIEDDELKLDFEIYFEEAKLCNWFLLTPFIAVNKSTKYPIIDKVVISDGLFHTQEILFNKEFSDTFIVTFEPQDVKRIIVYTTQKYSYETDIGHFYTLKVNSDTNVFDSIKKDNHRRIEGHTPSVELLGIKYNPNNKTFIQPNYVHIKDSAINTNNIKNEIFTIPQPKNDYEHSDLEVIKGFRYSTSIKNINISNIVFNEEGIYCSKPFRTEENIVSIELVSHDYIPESFKNDSEQVVFNPSTYIRYEISFDEGNLWYEIYPKHRVHFGPCTYHINSNTLPSMRNPKTIKYIDRVLDTTSVMLRIKMKRPEGYIYDTPIVYDYKLNVITEG